MRREEPAEGRRLACLVGSCRLRKAGVSLLEVCREFSPWLEASGEGCVWLDVRGCGSLFGGETLLGEALVKRAEEWGWRVRVGIAGSKAIARIAAERGTGVVNGVPPGRDREAIAGLSPAVLGPSAAAAEAFRRWGVRTVAALAALPAGEVALRLGAEGARLHGVASGVDEAPLVPASFPDEPEEEVDLEYPIVEVEPLLFVLRGALERLAARLAERGVAFGELQLRLRLEPEGSDLRGVELAAPTRDVPSVLALLRVSLETSPPSAPLVGFRLRARPGRTRPGQLSLFVPAGPSPEKLAVTLARLAALVGADRVGEPRRSPEHRSSAPVAARRLRPPLEAVVEGGVSGRDAAVEGWTVRTADARLSGRILRASGPWRLRGGWWGEAPIDRDYYDVELSGGVLLRLFREVATDSWRVDGVYD